MDDLEKQLLVDLQLAPYIQKATALIGIKRKVGGNQFRHAMATLAILIDYHITDAVILKASVIHDLFEDIVGYNQDEIRNLDMDGINVTNLVLEVTKGEETKEEFLQRIMVHGSVKAKLLKVADRISNLTDLNQDIFNEHFFERYLDESEKFIYPIALEVNENMALEVRDLIDRRRIVLEKIRDLETQ